MSLDTLPISASLPTNYEYNITDGINQAKHNYSTANDKLIRMYSGALHYSRVPRASWRDKLKKHRTARLKAIEKHSGDFGNGFLHQEEFLKIEGDLFVILSTGPLIFLETNFRDSPTWPRREKTKGLRISEPIYLKFVRRYFNVLLTLLASFQFTKGGPVISCHVETQFQNQDAGDKFQTNKAYLEQLRQLFINNGFVGSVVMSDSPLSNEDEDNVFVLVNGALEQLKYPTQIDRWMKMNGSNVTSNQEAMNGITMDIVVKEWGRIYDEIIDQYNKISKGHWQDESQTLNWVEVFLELFVYTFFYMTMVHPNIRNLTKK